MNISAALLSGGRSKRMGRDKATAPVHGRPLIAYTYDVVEKVFDDIILVSNYHEAIPGINPRMVRDTVPARGSLTGVVSALLNATTEYVFVFACDMPFLREKTIRYMIDRVRGEDILIPKTDKGVEPLHAIYRRSCISPMLTAIARGIMKIQDVFPFLCVRMLQENEVFANNGVSVFTNVNTEEDLRRAEGLLR